MSVSLAMSSCVAVKEYAKVNLKDVDMRLAARSINRFESNVHLYREGASGGAGAKTGGGCGCN